MGLICEIFGHNFSHDESEVTPTWSRTVTPCGPISGWYRTIRVPKECSRCGYRHSNTFKVPGDWPTQPEPPQ